MTATWNDLRWGVLDATFTLENHDPELPETDPVQIHLDIAMNALDEVYLLIKDREGMITP